MPKLVKLTLLKLKTPTSTLIAKSNAESLTETLRRQEIEQMPDDRKRIIKEVLDAFILKADLQQKLAS